MDRDRRGEDGRLAVLGQVEPFGWPVRDERAEVLAQGPVDGPEDLAASALPERLDHAHGLRALSGEHERDPHQTLPDHR